MWTVDNIVGKAGVKNVEPRYPQKRPTFCNFIQSLYPRLFFSVYSDLGDLLGFPRPYYYY